MLLLVLHVKSTSKFKSLCRDSAMWSNEEFGLQLSPLRSIRNEDTL